MNKAMIHRWNDAVTEISFQLLFHIVAISNDGRESGNDCFLFSENLFPLTICSNLSKESIFTPCLIR